MRRLRFRTRALLIVVALSALALFAARMWRRATDYRARASAAETAGRLWVASASTSEAAAAQTRGELQHEPVPQERLIVARRAKEYESHAAMCREQASYYVALQRKYDRGASRPWESIAPDPRDRAAEPTAWPRAAARGRRVRSLIAWGTFSSGRPSFSSASGECACSDACLACSDACFTSDHDATRSP